MLQFIKPWDYNRERDKFVWKIDRQAGKGNWFWVFRVGKRIYSWNWGLQLYEDAYFEFFRKNIPKLKTLVQDYSDVFEFNRHDLESNIDYRKQTQPQDHFQDIAVRRCLVRLGLVFKGKPLLEMPGSDFDDRKVRFHLPQFLTDSLETSCHSFLDGNRLIVVAKEIEDKAKLAENLVK